MYTCTHKTVIAFNHHVERLCICLNHYNILRPYCYPCNSVVQVIDKECALRDMRGRGRVKQGCLPLKPSPWPPRSFGGCLAWANLARGLIRVLSTTNIQHLLQLWSHRLVQDQTWADFVNHKYLISLPFSWKMFACWEFLYFSISHTTETNPRRLCSWTPRDNS